MPPPPIFADRAGKIGVVEVFRQGNAEEFPDADGHIAVAGEVKIQLHHIRRVAQHKNRCRQRGGGHRCDLCVDQRQLISDDGLFGKAQHQPLDAVAEAVRRNAARLPAGVKLRGLLPIADNGAGRPVAEERKKHREPEGAFFGGDAPCRDICTVADGREHIKADTQRQGRGQHRHKARRKSVYRFSRKARIFKDAQHRQIEQHQRRQQRAFVGQPPQRQPAQPVDAGQQHQNGRALQPRPGKKQQAERAQHRIAQPFGAEPVDRQRQRQKNKQKLHRGKCHIHTTPRGTTVGQRRFIKILHL